MASKSKFSKMTTRVAARDDNIYHPKIISTILNMYLDECRKALLKGENVQLRGIGTLMPEVKAHVHYNLPECNREGGNLPYTRVRMTRTNSLAQEMNRKLQENIENGILGLEELPFSKQQIAILRNSGMIPDEETENEEE